MPDRQIFYDPGRKRWKRLRRILDITAVVSTLVVAGFIFNVLRGQRLPELLLPLPRHNYKALPDTSPLRNAKNQRPARRKTKRKPSEIPLNTGEGLRAAYYVQDDAGSYSSLKDHVQQIDLLFPQWLHVDSPQGTLMMMSGDNLREYPVIQQFQSPHPGLGHRCWRRAPGSRQKRRVSPTDHALARHVSHLSRTLSRY
jgi:hypothetical protein